MRSPYNPNPSFGVSNDGCSAFLLAKTYQGNFYEFHVFYGIHPTNKSKKTLTVQVKVKTLASLRLDRQSSCSLLFTLKDRQLSAQNVTFMYGIFVRSSHFFHLEVIVCFSQLSGLKLSVS